MSPVDVVVSVRLVTRAGSAYQRHETDRVSIWTDGPFVTIAVADGVTVQLMREDMMDACRKLLGGEVPDGQ